MSLDFDVSKIENHKEVTTQIDAVTGKAHWHPTTSNIVWRCIPIRMGRITEDNWQEWYARSTLWYRMVGLGKGPDITAEDVKRHIGLKTNVFGTYSKDPYTQPRPSWMKEVVGRYLDDLVREAQKYGN